MKTDAFSMAKIQAELKRGSSFFVRKIFQMPYYLKLRAFEYFPFLTVFTAISRASGYPYMKKLIKIERWGECKAILDETEK